MRTPKLLILLLALVPIGLDAETARASPERAVPPPAEHKSAAVPEIQFYLAHGDAGACGRGCDGWIAAEGKIDLRAAQRLRHLLARLGPGVPRFIFIRREDRWSARLRSVG
jgi:hypothetical protein